MERDEATVGSHLGRRLRERREARGMTRDQLAARLGTSPCEVAMFEDGTKRIPPRHLIQAAEALGASLQWFLEGAPSLGSGAPLGQVSRDLVRFLSMPESYQLISAFIAISNRERRQSVVRQAQAVSQAERQRADA